MFKRPRRWEEARPRRWEEAEGRWVEKEVANHVQ
jgi:hypothetical protein